MTRRLIMTVAVLLAIAACGNSLADAEIATDTSPVASSPTTSSDSLHLATGQLLVRHREDPDRTHFLSPEGDPVASVDHVLSRPLWSQDGSPALTSLIADGDSRLAWIDLQSLDLRITNTSGTLAIVPLHGQSTGQFVVMTDGDSGSAVADLNSGTLRNLDVTLDRFGGRALGDSTGMVFDTERRPRILNLETAQVSDPVDDDFFTLSSVDADREVLLYREALTHRWHEMTFEGADRVLVDSEDIVSLEYTADGSILSIEQQSIRLLAGTELYGAPAGSRLVPFLTTDHGTLVAALRPDAAFDYVWVDHASGSVSPVDVPASAMSPAGLTRLISATDRLIVGVDVRGEGIELHAISLRGGLAVKLGSVPEDATLVAIQKEVGDRFAFAYFADGEQQWWLVDPITLDVSIIRGPVLLQASPDGRLLAYSNRESHTTSVATIEEPNHPIREFPGTLLSWLPER